MLGGRVKTLHPRIHAAILARRDHPEDLAALDDHGIEPIDLVCVGFYPFTQIVSRHGVTETDAVEMIDIGGPSMLRAAAKNFAHVAPVCSREALPGNPRGAPHDGEALGRHPAAPGGRGLRDDRRVRDCDRDLVPGTRGVPRPLHPQLHEGRRPLVRGESPPACRVLRRGGRAAASPLPDRPAARQAALVQQPERPLGGPAAARRVPAARGGRRQACEPGRSRRLALDRGRVPPSPRRGSCLCIRDGARSQPAGELASWRASLPSASSSS